jgi:3-deoxy-D-manno-octulosonic-acid transferase
MLEPSAYGAAVAFGPHTRNFQAEVAGLLAVKAARVVHDQQQLTEFVTWGIEHQADRDAMGARAAAVVAAGRGATDLTIRRLLSVLRRMPAA